MHLQKEIFLLYFNTEYKLFKNVVCNVLGNCLLNLLYYPLACSIFTIIGNACLVKKFFVFVDFYIKLFVVLRSRGESIVYRYLTFELKSIRVVKCFNTDKLHIWLQLHCKHLRERSGMKSSCSRLMGLCRQLNSRERHLKMHLPTLKCCVSWVMLQRPSSRPTKTCVYKTC